MRAWILLLCLTTSAAASDALPVTTRPVNDGGCEAWSRQSRNEIEAVMLRSGARWTAAEGAQFQELAREICLTAIARSPTPPATADGVAQ